MCKELRFRHDYFHKPFFTYCFIMNNKYINNKEKFTSHCPTGCFRNTKKEKMTKALRWASTLWYLPMMKLYLFFFDILHINKAYPEHFLVSSLTILVPERDLDPQLWLFLQISVAGLLSLPSCKHPRGCPLALCPAGRGLQGGCNVESSFTVAVCVGV